MSSLYEYLKNDRENVLGRITKSLVKKMYLNQQYHKDAEQECYLAWIEAEYEPLFDNDGIISYAYNCARLRLAEWRRRTLLPVCTVRTERPEPFGLSIDSLHGDDLDRLLYETENIRSDPLDDLIAAESEAIADENDEWKLSDIQLPPDPKGKKQYGRIIELLAEGATVVSVAAEVGVDKRTIYRHLNTIKAANSGIGIEKRHAV